MKDKLVKDSNNYCIVMSQTVAFSTQFRNLGKIGLSIGEMYTFSKCAKGWSSFRKKYIFCFSNMYVCLFLIYCL